MNNYKFKKCSLKSRVQCLVVVFLFSSWCSFVSFGQQGIVDPTFNTFDDGLQGDGFDGTVRASALQADGRLLVGGDFLNFNGATTPYLCRLLPDGSKDLTFINGLGLNGRVYSILLLNSGKILVGGSFTSYNGIVANRIVRLNTDGSIDLSFNTIVGANTGIIHKMVEQPDGKAVIVGTFTRYDNITANRVARVNTDGTLDLTFVTGSGSSSLVEEVELQTDGKIIIGGSFVSFNGVACGRIVRLSSSGSVDTTFLQGNGFDDNVSALSILPDGKLIVGGEFLFYNGISAGRLVRLNSDGTLDASFASGTGFSNGIVESIKVNSNGSILVGGSFTGTYNGLDCNRIILLNSSGGSSTSFDLGEGPASGTIYTFIDDGVYYYGGGSFSVFDGQNQGRLARFDSIGSIDIAYLSAGVGFDNSVLKIVSQPDDKLVVVGSFSKYNNLGNSRVIRLLANGLVDPTFNVLGSGANNTVRTAVVQDDQKIIIGGSFTSYNGLVANRIVRLLPNGGTDVTFNSGLGFNNQVYAVALQSDGKLLVVGNFTTYNGVAVARVVRLLPDGILDVSFNVGTGPDAIVECVLLQPDGAILLGGQFGSCNGIGSSRIVRLQPNGAVDTSFSVGSGFDKTVFVIALQEDGKVMAGGSFLTYKGNPARKLVRLNADGSQDASLVMGSGFTTGDVRSILIQPDGRLLIGGTFAGTYNGVGVKRLLRLLPNGTYDTSFTATLNSTAFTLAFTNSNKLLIGGNFNSVSGVTKHRIAQLKLCTNTTIWNGAMWSNGLPSPEKTLFFDADYTFSDTVTACSCTVRTTANLLVSSGFSFNLDFDYSGLGSLTIESGAVLYQKENEVLNGGQMIMKRRTTPILKSDYTYWSSPVANQVLGTVSPNAPQDRLFSFSSATKNWFTELSTALMIPAKGYIIRGPNDYSETVRAEHEVSFSGIPNNGTISIPVVGSSTFNLIGNPYPSAVNADLLYDLNKDVIAGSMYFWTHNTAISNSLYSSADYAVYNLFGGVSTAATNTGANNQIPQGKIASGQSFFVMGINSGGNVIFDNSMRISDQNNFFFKTSASKKTVENPVEKHRIWINLSNAQGAFKQVLLGYSSDATNEIDPALDAVSYNGNAVVNLYSLASSKNLAIQAKALPFAVSDTFVLGYKSEIDGVFSLSLDHMDGIFIHQPIFIEDKVTGSIVPLTKQGYNFNTTKGVFNDRFVLRFSGLELGSPQYETERTILSIIQNNKVMQIGLQNQILDELWLFTIDGKEVYYKKDIQSAQYTIPLLPISQQAAVLKVKDENGKFHSKKVFLR